MADEQPSGLRERKKQRRRQALHEAALRLIEKQGLERTTVTRCTTVSAGAWSESPSWDAATTHSPVSLQVTVAPCSEQAPLTAKATGWVERPPEATGV